EAKAQKAEIKAWKKRKKHMEPLQFKEIVEENMRLKARGKQLETEITTYQEKVKSYEEEVQKTVKLEEDTTKLEAEVKQLRGLLAKKSTHNVEEGEYYEYEEDLETDEALHDAKGGQALATASGKGNSSTKPRRKRRTVQGLIFKVQVGVFEGPEGYWKADKLKEELRQQGKKTWIVVFKDGKRIPLKAALKGILKKKPQK
ncbi:MAG: hypothetical protein AAFQ78_00965, partial [Bacteroidota bacterium]